MGEMRQLPRRGAFTDEGVKAVESPGIAQNDLAPLGGIGIYIRQGGKIGGQGWYMAIPC